MTRRTQRKKRTDLPAELSAKDYFGYRAHGHRQTLESSTIGALPIINHVLQRMNLRSKLQAHLPREDGRTKISTSDALLLLIRNALISREPLYGVEEWAEHYQPSLLGLACIDQLDHLNDDRIGRALDKLFDVDIPTLILDVLRHVVAEFQLELRELHNDATTLSVFGQYADAREEQRLRGRQRIALMKGHSKARRPDLRQLLYTLVITDDGGVPVYYAVHSGNAAESDTHRATWDFLCQLIGRTDFLYIADCKLATSENMRYLASNQGRFITVLPATRKEEREFRKRLLKTPDAIEWDVLYETLDDQDQLVKRISRCRDTTLSAEGYQILWCHNTQKQLHDINMRTRQIQRAIRQLNELRDKLHSPKTRYRDRAKVAQAVENILQSQEVERWVEVEIEERKEFKYKAQKRGRHHPDTQFTRSESLRFNLTYSVDSVRLAEDNATAGIFSLITNVTDLTDEEIVRAYGRQPLIEKRFTNMKSDYQVSPVYLKETSRIQALMCVYFFALVAQALLEREMRAAMSAQYESLPLYPEERDCKSPTSRRIIDLFEGIQCHTLRQGEEEHRFFTELSPLQSTILQLLGVSGEDYGL